MQYGQVWDAGELAREFEVLGFTAPYVVVKRPSDGRKGSLEFHLIMRNRYDNSDFWGEPMHVYTRAQAIADGLLVDLTAATDDRGH